MKILPKLQVNGKISIVITLCAVFSIVGIATAQELQRTYTLINPSIEQKLNPGGRAEGTTKIINESNIPLTFSVTVQDFIVTDNVGTPNLLPPNTLSNKYSAASWIGVSPSIFTLEPAHSQVINYYIQTPTNARPGGHYAALIYEPSSSSVKNKTGGNVNTQVGSLFYITINGPIHENAKVTQFTANWFQEYGPIKMLTQIKNFGDLHITPKGSVAISGLLFNQRQDLSIHNIFPEAVRDFENTFGSTLMLGRYKAQLTATYGQNNNLPLVATFYVWVFPWRLAIVIVLIIVVIILGIMYIKKRKEKGPKAPQEPKKEAEETAEEAKNPEVA